MDICFRVRTPSKRRRFRFIVPYVETWKIKQSETVSLKVLLGGPGLYFAAVGHQVFLLYTWFRPQRPWPHLPPPCSSPEAHTLVTLHIGLKPLITVLLFYLFLLCWFEWTIYKLCAALAVGLAVCCCL